MMGHMDRTTDGQIDKVIPTYLIPPFGGGGRGIKKGLASLLN